MTSDNPRRIAVITGASSGIGKAAAKLLLADGWHVIAHGRDAGRTATAAEELRAATPPGARLDMVQGDLALLAETARLADEIAALTPRIDALLCNAGGVRAEKLLTSEGNEATFSGNHLGHFLLVQRLMPQLIAAGAARVIATSSSGHQVAPPIDWNDPQMIEHWTSAPAYCLAKLYNILFTRELARRGADVGIVAHAMHPGIVGTNFASHGNEQMQTYMAAAQLDPPERSAATLAWLASAPEPGQSSGRYWFDKAETEPSAAAQDDDDARRLWQVSEELLANAGFKHRPLPRLP